MDFDFDEGYQIAEACGVLNLLLAGIIFVIGLTYSPLYEPIN